ncbi:MAG: 30S ribosomal protein S16 [Candidatus Abawacabacteria bacterium RBG_16_42_10]|uniref:Small ribosomal subunit protein bS16 n=1 Tax=Candidatus Abawacabacteria bacterium RBG_16_42_10 TaxID=1817814 RepID=A0A1F4XIQ3_9BACT|nr:MAG: 30S ribosomal protein S16 [Candidatus Abawacabacteria bacterium RBG_16_42_10]
MLRIRLARVGRPNQPRYRVVVTEHTNPAKKKYNEVLGNYLPTEKPKKLIIDLDRFKYWVSKGAKPTQTVADLVKRVS